MASSVPRIRASRESGAPTRKQLNAQLAKFVKDLVTAIQIIMVTNAKLDKNSELVQSTEILIRETKDNIELELLLNEYWINVEYGRKKYPKRNGVPGEGQFATEFGMAIFKWIKKLGIQFGGLTANQMTFLITRSINRKGIKKRPFIKKVGDQMTTYLNFFIENELYNTIIADFQKYMST